LVSVWPQASFAVAIIPAAAHECPQEGCVTDGRMTGGGRLATTSMIVTHGFELHCDASDVPNNLQINWDGGNRFHLGELTDVKCLDSPAISPNPPPADFDLMEAHGTGTYNGEEGASIYFVLTDAGEPGKNDRARFLIEDSDGNTVLNVSAKLKGGNHQAH
jgi:hypothetical protein